jgi:hypothetical protein
VPVGDELEHLTLAAGELRERASSRPAMPGSATVALGPVVAHWESS